MWRPNGSRTRHPLAQYRHRERRPIRASQCNAHRRTSSGGRRMRHGAESEGRGASGTPEKTPPSLPPTSMYRDDERRIAKTGPQARSPDDGLLSHDFLHSKGPSKMETQTQPVGGGHVPSPGQEPEGGPSLESSPRTEYMIEEGHFGGQREGLEDEEEDLFGHMAHGIDEDFQQSREAPPSPRL